MNMLKYLGFLMVIIFLSACSVKSTKGITNSAEDDSVIERVISLKDRLLSTPGVFMQGSQVRLRGGDNSFFSDSEPLFEINGQIVTGGYSSIRNLVSAEEIKSIRVLKNPTDLSLYGVRGSNGVIRIKLKNSK